MRQFLIVSFFIYNLCSTVHGQNKHVEKSIRGKYDFKEHFYGGEKLILKLKKNHKYVEISNRPHIGILKRYGEWEIIGDSIAITIKYQSVHGKTDTILTYPKFKFKIEKNGLCETFVLKSYVHGYQKIETCYKKRGRISKIYPSRSYVNINNPGYEGPWRNEK
jgi:hypothetical protein